MSFQLRMLGGILTAVLWFLSSTAAVATPTAGANLPVYCECYVYCSEVTACKRKVWYIHKSDTNIADVIAAAIGKPGQPTTPEEHCREKFGNEAVKYCKKGGPKGGGNSFFGWLFQPSIEGCAKAEEDCRLEKVTCKTKSFVGK